MLQDLPARPQQGDSASVVLDPSLAGSKVDGDLRPLSGQARPKRDFVQLR
jgi:hypothetical protein